MTPSYVRTYACYKYLKDLSDQGPSPNVKLLSLLASYKL